MIIEIAEFNPYQDNEPYSLAQAAKDPQFTLKQAGTTPAAASATTSTRQGSSRPTSC